MDVWAFLLAVAALIMTLTALRRYSRVMDKLDRQQKELEALSRKLATLLPVEAAPAASTAATDSALKEVLFETPQQAQEKQQPTSNWISSSVPASERAPMPPQPPPLPEPTRQATRPRDVEQAVASRLFVWIGGIAIAIGGLLFIKYAYDNGLISAGLQIILGLIFGIGLVIAGEIVRRRSRPLPAGEINYVPAALSAAGLMIVFASIYAGYALYGLYDSIVAFAGLALTGLAALALSRWQGPFIAVLGLLGSFATPALIPSEHASAWGFFSYLLVIEAACFLILRSRNWWWLGLGAIAGGVGWAMLWLNSPMFSPEHVMPIGIFGLVSLLLALLLPRDAALVRPAQADGVSLSSKAWERPEGLVPIVAIIAVIVMQTTLVDLSMHASLSLWFFAASLLLVCLVGWRNEAYAPLAPAAMLMGFLELMNWSEAAFHELAMDESGIWSSVIGPAAWSFLKWTLALGTLFLVFGLLGTLRKRSQAFALTAAGGGVLYLWGAWGRVSILIGDALWALMGLAGGLALLGALLVKTRRPAELGRLESISLAAGSALLFLFTIDRLLDDVWQTLAVAVLATAYAALAARTVIRSLATVAGLVASFAAVRLFVARELWWDEVSLPWGKHWVIYGYGIPAILFVFAAKLVRRAGFGRAAAALEGSSLALAIALVSIELRILIGGELTGSIGLVELSSHVLAWLGAAYGLVHRQQLYSAFTAKWGAVLLIGLAFFVMLTGTLTLYNPVQSGDPVQGGLVLNGLFLAYLAPAILLFAISRKVSNMPVQLGLGLAALALAFIYVTLETKRVYQGPSMVFESLSLAESYAYSAVWLASGVALFIGGLALAKPYLRYAGLGVMVVVVLKVFLVDMSNLEGLYRIASFVGLGLCLVGIGWLYQRFGPAPASQQETQATPAGP